MTADEQLELWVKGISIHNNDVSVNGKFLIGGECCPDFSCCRPDLLAPKEVREIFAAASRSGKNEVVDRMLGVFLSKLVDGRNVHVVGIEEKEERN